MTSRIYLDHAATSPLRPEALAAMEEGFAIWANPSSPHAEGRKAKQALEDARERVKRALGWNGEVIFTSGASEALWIALNRAKVKRRIVSAVEHDAVFRAAPDAEVVPVLPRHFARAIGTPPSEQPGNLNLGLLPDCDGAIVAVQHVNSETGKLQPIPEIVQHVRQRNGLVLCDCSQSAGKIDLPDADMIVISAHKFGGPIGIGALLVRDYNLLEPIGGHERGYRQGTENLPDVLGMASALECPSFVGLSAIELTEASEIVEGDLIMLAGAWAPHIFAIGHPTLSAQALLIRLDAMGFAVSAGSACSSGTLKKSRVLDAFGVPDDVAARTIRVSLGWNTTAAELEAFAEAWNSLG